MNQQENGESIVLNQLLTQEFSFQFYVTLCIKQLYDTWHLILSKIDNSDKTRTYKSVLLTTE